MTKSSQAVTQAIEALDPQVQVFAGKLIDRVTIIVGESQCMLLEDNDRLRADNERIRAQMGRLVVQVEGLRQDVEALMTARMVGGVPDAPRP